MTLKGPGINYFKGGLVDYFNEGVVSVKSGLFKVDFFWILYLNLNILDRFGPILFHIWFGRYWAEDP